jgi:hypothetical protein
LPHGRKPPKQPVGALRDAARYANSFPYASMPMLAGVRPTTRSGTPEPIAAAISASSAASATFSQTSISNGTEVFSTRSARSNRA